MDIQEATSIIKCIPAIYRHRGYYDKDGKWFEGEGNLLTEKEITAIETILSELDKDNNIISDLQNEVTLKQCELDKKDKIINDIAERIYQLQDEKLLAGYSKQEVIDHFANKYEEGKG